MCAPAREPAPFWPRPDVLPSPDPGPRPTRLRWGRALIDFVACSALRSITAPLFCSEVHHGDTEDTETTRSFEDSCAFNSVGSSWSPCLRGELFVVTLRLRCSGRSRRCGRLLGGRDRDLELR